jgi:hypothetical protein
LPEAEQRELAWEILRRTVNFDLPSLSDEELVLSAEELFLELDRREANKYPEETTRRSQLLRCG